MTDDIHCDIWIFFYFRNSAKPLVTYKAKSRTHWSEVRVKPWLETNFAHVIIFKTKNYICSMNKFIN